MAEVQQEMFSCPPVEGIHEEVGNKSKEVSVVK